MSHLPTFDAPDALALVREVNRFLDEEVYGAVADARINYRVKVAANLLKLAAREMAAQVEALDADGRAATARLIAEFGGLAQMTAALERGDLSIVDAEVFVTLGEYTQARVAVAAEPPRPRKDPS